MKQEKSVGPVLLLLPFLHYGVGRLALDLAAALRARGVGTRLVTCGRTEDPGDDPGMIDEYLSSGGMLHHADLFTRNPERMRETAREMEALWDLCAPALAHAFTAPAAAALLSRAPVISTAVGWGPHKLDEQKRMDAEILERCAEVTAVSEAMRNELREARLQRENVVLIHNGVQVFGGPAPARNPNRPVRIGVMAQLIRRKGVDVLIDSLDLLSSDAPLELRVAGQGEAEAELKKLTGRLRGKVAVHWLGLRPVAEFMASIDILAIPSRSDALPLTLLHGMAHGLPIVATHIGGITGAIRDGVEGLLVPVEDPAAMARAIQRLILDPQLASSCAQAARRRAEREFSVEAMVMRYFACYCRLAPELSPFISREVETGHGPMPNDFSRRAHPLESAGS